MGLDVLQPPSSGSGSSVTITGPLDGGDGVAAGLPLEAGGFVWNGASWDRQRGAAGDARPATGLTAAAVYTWNGATWDRQRGTIANGMAVDVTRVQGTVTVTSGGPFDAGDGVAAGTTPRGAMYIWNNAGGVWDRLRGTGGNLTVNQGNSAPAGWKQDLTLWVSSTIDAPVTPGDAVASPTSLPPLGTFPMMWNGATWSRMRGSVANGLLVDVSRVQGSVAVTGPIGVTQSTSPWVVSGTVAVSSVGGTVAVTQSTSPWVVSSSQTTPADALANTAGLPIVGQIEVWNGATWDRAREPTADALAVTGIQASGLMGWNGASWDRLRTGADNADALAGSATGVLRAIAAGFLWNATGGNWSRARDANIGDGASAVGVFAAQGYVFNGSTHDKVRGDTTQGMQVGLKRTSIVVVAKSAANTTVTATLAAAGAGIFHYITAIEITRSSTAALAGTATFDYTSTNLPGAWALTVGNGMAAGDTKKDFAHEYVHPLKASAANTATTIVAPAAGAAVLTHIMVTYYTGP